MPHSPLITAVFVAPASRRLSGGHPALRAEGGTRLADSRPEAGATKPKAPHWRRSCSYLTGRVCGLALDEESMPTLGLSMIVKNEAQTLGPCLQSVSGIVSQIVVADTGSTDSTADIARRIWRDCNFHSVEKSLRQCPQCRPRADADRLGPGPGRRRGTGHSAPRVKSRIC